MSTSEHTSDQVKLKETIPSSVSLSTEDCLASSKELKGKVVVVTGAGSGFGRAYSLLAASYGAKVVASDIRVETVEDVVQEIKKAGGEAIATQCNVADWDSQVSMFRLAINTYGVVDSVIVNAGVTEAPGWLDDKEGPDGEPVKPPSLTTDVNLIGASYTTRLAFYHLKKNPSTGLKSIVLLGSMSSFFGIPLAPMYSMSKHAMMGLFRSLYYSAEPIGININICCPWFVATGILDTGARLAVAGLPLATVDNVVEAIFKASSDLNYSGYILSVDASGVLSISHDSFFLGEGGYYRAFLNRAAFAISAIKTAQDVVAAIRVGRRPSPQKTAVKAVGIAAIAWEAYNTGGYGALSVSGMVARGAAAAALLAI